MVTLISALSFGRWGFLTGIWIFQINLRSAYGFHVLSEAVWDSHWSSVGFESVSTTQSLGLVSVSVHSGLGHGWGGLNYNTSQCFVTVRMYRCLWFVDFFSFFHHGKPSRPFRFSYSHPDPWNVTGRGLWLPNWFSSCTEFMRKAKHESEKEISINDLLCLIAHI